MLRFLFPGLTTAPGRGAPLFDAVTSIAREPHWYVDGKVPDTLEGRFRLLATVAALVIVKLERDSDQAESVGLTERFIEVMESEHRELGLGDPALGRTVRRLVGSLARRVALWSSAVDGGAEWSDAARESVYKADVAEAPLSHTAEALRSLWSDIQGSSIGALARERNP
jgi:cytochrome b pre-mRNA-processing protein 3